LNIETITLFAIFVPLLGSMTVPLAGLISRQARSDWSVLLALLTVAFNLLLLPSVINSGSAVFRHPLILGCDYIIIVDALSVFMSLVSSVLGALIVIYSTGYVRDDDNQSEYYMMVLLFIGAMMGLVYSANLIFLYLFWEISAICSWRLVGFYRQPIHLRRANKTFLVTFFGAVVMLLGFILVYRQTGTFDITAMRGVVIPGTAVLLILVGMFSKSATLPLHTWLPDAGVAPSTVTAMLHAAILVKIGVYAYARIFVYGFTMPHQWNQAVLIIVVFSSLVAAAAATIETDLKRILAYSTVSQIGYIFFGLALMNLTGVTGALLFILMHGLAKAGLFLCAGVVEHNTHKRDIRDLGGLIRTMPVTAIVFLLCTFSIIGLPPFGGFFSKFMVILAAVETGHAWLAGAALFVAVFTVFYLFRLFNTVFLGELKVDRKEGTPVMLVVIAVLAFLSLCAGLLVKYPMDLVNAAATVIFGGKA